MTRRNGGLLARLLAAAVVAGAAAAAVGASAQWSAARDALRSEIAERNAALAGELAARMDSRIESQIVLLDLVATRRPVADLAPDAAAELRAVLGASTPIDELVLYDGTGRAVAAAANRYVAVASEEPARADLVEATTSGPSVHLDVERGYMLEVVVGVENPPGTTVGALAGRIPLEVIASPSVRADSGEGGTRFLVAGDGRIVVHPERNRVVTGEERPIDDLLREGASDQAVGLELDGDQYLVAAARMERLDAAIVIEQSESDALAPVRDQLRELSAILAAVIGATVLAIMGAGAWLLGPLGPLTRAVRRLGRHERGVRVQGAGRGEVAELAGEFNRLAEALDQRDEELGELQRLSLLVNTRTSPIDVAEEVATGATRLLRIDAAAFCTADHGLPEIAAVQGGVAEGAVVDLAATSIRIGRSHCAADGHGAAVPIRSLEGRTVGALVAFRSAAPLEETELALLETYASFAGVAIENVARLDLERQLGAELADAVEQRRSLISTVSHEFRTPLTCIDGFSSTLLAQWDDYDDEQRRDLVGKIRHHSRDLDELVSRLLDFAVTERGTLVADQQPVALADLVAAVAGASQPLLAGRPFSIEVPPDLIVSADPVLLGRALSNLLSNAAKYSDDDAPIVVRAVDDGQRIRLEVIDEGAGLAAEEAARAFQPFWRGGDAATRAKRGSGLGLALVAEYAEAMGGSPGVVSEPGYGSTFFITLPPAASGDDQPGQPNRTLG